MCGTKGKECAICACGDGCVASFRDDYFSPASERQLVERLNNNRFPNYRQLMIDTLKKHGREYNGYEELEPLPEQQVCCTQIKNLCDTCRKSLICPVLHINLRDKCELYEKLPNPLDEIVTETRSLNPIKEEKSMRFEEALKAMLEGKRTKRACYETTIAYSQERHKFCFWCDDDVSGRDGTHYGCEVEFSQSDRVADDWCVISDIPSSIIKAMEERKAKALEEIGKEAEKKAEVTFNRLEITFKSGETISYSKGGWDDYAYDGNAVIVKKNSAWIGIYNFDDVFCVELKEK